MRVALFITCFNDLLFPDVGRSVVRLLRRLGHDVVVPEGQTCCGQIHFNTGYREACVPLVRRFGEVFADAEVVVTPSASCAAMIRHHHRTIAADTGAGGDASLLRQVESMSPRVYELTEFLTEVAGVVDVGARFDHTVAYHPTCHSLRLLGLGDGPRRLLEAVEGLSLVDIAGAEECCGFGGTFAVKNADTSVAMGRDKLAAVAATGAEVLTSADTSCLMHLGGLASRQARRARRAEPALRVMHIAEILAADGTTP